MELWETVNHSSGNLLDSNSFQQDIDSDRTGLGCGKTLISGFYVDNKAQVDGGSGVE